MYRLLMIITLVAAFKIFIAYLIAKIKSCKKNTISAEELIQFKGITRKQYEERVAPIMWDNESYYEQLKLDVQESIIYNKLNENTNKSIKQTKNTSIENYHKEIEEEYKMLKDLFKEKNSRIN